MPKRVYVIGVVSAVALLGGVLTASLVATSGDPSQPISALGAPADGSIDASFDESTAVEVSRDAYTVTERDAAGVMKATVSQQVSSVLRDGEWVPISTELTTLDDGTLAAEDHPLEPVFAPSSGADDLVRVQNQGYTLSLSLEGVDTAEANEVAASGDVADGTAVRYQGAADGADLLFQVGQQALYQTVVLDSAPAAQLEYVWILDAQGLDAQQQDAGDIQFVAPNGDVIFDVPGPVMWDSLGGEGGMAESASTPVDYTLVGAGEGKWRLSLAPDMAWLTDSARVYPVSIDPDIYQGSGMVATYKENNFTYNYASVPRIGNTKETSTCCAWRTVLRYPMNAYFGKRVLTAALVANWTYGTTTNQAASVWWATAFRFDGNGAKIQDFAISSQGVAYGGVFNMVASILNNSDQYSYLMLVGEENNGIYSRKDLSTYVTFTYVDPAVVTGVTGPSPTSAAAGPIAKAYVDDIVVQATGTNNTPGTTQLFRYNFTSSDGGVAWNSGWVASGALRLPDTALTPGKNYTYSIDTMDTGTDSPVTSMSNSSVWRFHTALAPGAVSAVTVDGKALSTDPTSSVARPVLSATVTSPEPGAVWAIFTVKRGGVVVMDGVAGSPATVTAGGSGPSSVELPYAITSDGSYTIEVQAFDGHLAGPSLSPPGSFFGPKRVLREIPGSQDTETGAAS